MHKVFVSYHHKRDQLYKEALVEFGERHSVFLDRSVDTDDIPSDWTDQQIRREIRDKNLRDSTVTVVLVGRETKRRKHVDWEIHSSMYDGSVNRRSGIVVVNLPGISDDQFMHLMGMKKRGYCIRTSMSWTHVDERQEYERRYPHLPDRIIDNLLKPKVKISVVPWAKINEETLEFLIEAAFRYRADCPYDLSRPPFRLLMTASLFALFTFTSKSLISAWLRISTFVYTSSLSP